MNVVGGQADTLIAGGAGFIGSHLADALLGAGRHVVCIDNLSLGSEALIHHCYSNPKFEFCRMDVCDTESLRSLFAKHSFRRVYHLAANSDIQNGGTDPGIDFHNTFLTTVTLLDAMRVYGVKEMLFASSSAVYGDKPGLLKEDIGDLRPVSYYGASKLASEAFISSYAAMNDLSAVVIRFPNVVGPRLTHGVVFDFIEKLRRCPKELEILGDGKQDKPYVYVGDLIEAIMSMKYEPGLGIFNVGVEGSTTVERIADIVCEETGLEGVKYKYTGGSAGWLGDVPTFRYDLAKIHSTGWKAKYTSDEAVRLAAKAMNNRKDKA